MIGIFSPKPQEPSQADFILLDRSGSMGTQWNEAVSSVNAYAAKLREDNVPTRITLAVFDSNSVGELAFKVIRESIAPADFHPVSIDEVEPRGGTPLNDAIGLIVSRAEAAKPDRCAIIIMTDGHENASKKLNIPDAKALLDACREKGWQVIFLGANFDNAQQAADYGNLAGQTISASSANLFSTMQQTGNMRSLYGSAGQNMFYSDEDKKKAK